MPDLTHYKALIVSRLKELGERIHDIEDELNEPKSADLSDQAIDLEDDEVLGGLELAAQKEVVLLKLSLARIKDGSYGICAECGDAISDERLVAVLYAPLCKHCASANENRRS